MSFNNPFLLDRAFVNGGWIEASSGETFAVTDPATDETIVEIANCGREEAVQAIAAAMQAQPAWRSTAAETRAAIMKKWRDLMIANTEPLAVLLSMECGKPLGEARGEIAYGASYVEFYAEEATRVYGETLPSPSADRRIVVLKEPVGVVAAITPWNFPNAMIARKAAPALAAGCTLVMKPAEATPLSALAMAKLAQEAGVPSGVLNVLPTDNASLVGLEITTHKDVRKISFTGSTEVGRKLLKNGAKTVKRASMELGGDAPFIVFDDADLDAAVDGAIASKFRNAGQTCVCANRFLVQSSIAETFVQKLRARVAAFKIGAGLEDGVDIGPLINREAVEKSEALIADALEKGAKVVVGGARHERGGNFFAPTILANVSAQMDVVRQEIFAPIAPIMTFETEEEAVDKANDTPFGLAAYFYTKDMARAWRVGEALEYGMVGLNAGILSSAAAPFGGVKQSGIGREGSRHGIEEYLELKYFCQAGLDR